MFVDEDDNHSSRSSSSSTPGGSSLGEGDDEFPIMAGNRSIPQRRPIASAENKALFRIRVMVVLVLTISAIGMACLVYFNTRKREQEHFESDFAVFAAKVLLNLGINIQTSLEAMDGFVVSVASFAQYNNMTWPYVTTPHFGTRASKVRSVTKSVLLTQIHTVTSSQRSLWEEYSLREGPNWVDQHIAVQNADPTFKGSKGKHYNTSGIWGHNPEANIYRPIWQSYPTLPLFGKSPYNLDLTLLTSLTSAVQDLEQRKAVIGYVSNDPGNATLRHQTNELLRSYLGDDSDIQEPLSELYYPIFENVADQVLDSNKSATGMVAILGSWFFWRDLLRKVLPHGCDGIVVVFQNRCMQTFSYQMNGPDVVFLGYLDAHQGKYSAHSVKAEFVDLLQDEDYTGYSLTDTICPYTVHVYPSEKMESMYLTSDPWIYTSIALVIFVFTTIVFISYDKLVERRQKEVLSSAAQSSAIVSSLFPPNIQARLYSMKGKDDGSCMESQRDQSTMFLSESSKDGAQSHVENSTLTGQPIADLFPNATVLFGDIAGFTAWSSTREPSQVFVLLETLYALFDSLATKRKVFKVETIGDCYMAVVGLPDPCPEHAVVSVKFARDCIVHMIELVEQLAFTLGPETEDLAVRFGLHSGPVTAGVLRGQKSRFQLFGDTVNTASRMESTGLRNHIHVSDATAQELKKYNKRHWLRPRNESVQVKGKGQMTTYWVDPNDAFYSSSNGESQRGGVSVVKISGLPVRIANRMEALIDWNTNVLARMLCSIVAFRNCRIDSYHDKKRRKASRALRVDQDEAKCVLDEVKDTIDFPEFEPCGGVVEPEIIQLDPLVLCQLHDFVKTIAEMYNGCTNAFHNFEHASHVCMSVTKLINCMVTTSNNPGGPDHGSLQQERAFGITSDPLTLFACVFAALIHDTGHPGVPNMQLVREGGPLLAKYHSRSVAEQVSLDLAWNLFLTKPYQTLRETICATPDELSHFRQLVVNLVMATDIMDKDFNQRREKRWERVFKPCIEDNNVDESVDHDASDVSPRKEIKRKATIVIEVLIQVSDIVHTMQHWHVYRKWNERLFEEMLKAYDMGRASKDPSEFWYRGEMDFFDKHVIPLAKKLKQCGVFGVSSDEYLNCALENRQEWELKGKQVVEEMVTRLKNH